jgi:tape measure domain-containing protein
MSEDLEFSLEVHDGFTGPFKDSAAAAVRVEREFARLEKQQSSAMREMDRAARVQKGAMRDVSGEAGRYANAMERAREANGRFVAGAKGAGGASSGMAGAMFKSSAALWAVHKAGEVVTAGFRRMVDFTRSVGETAVHTEALKMSFSALAGSQKGGQAAFARTSQLSDQLGLRFESTAESMRELLAQQFTLGEATDLIKMVGDLRAVGIEGEKAQRVMTALTQIKAKGRVQQEELAQLAEASVAIPLIKKHMMELKGIKDIPALDKLQAAGKIDAATGIEAIKRAVMEKTHESALGQRGTEFADKTMQGAIGRVGASWDKLMLGVVEAAQPAFLKVGAFAKNLGTALDNPKIASGLERAFTNLGSVLDQFDASTIGDGLISLVDYFENVSTAASSFIGGFVEGFGQADGVASEFKAADLKKEFRQIGEGAGELARGLTSILTGMRDIAASPAIRVISGLFSVLDVGTKVVTGEVFEEFKNRQREFDERGGNSVADQERIRALKESAFSGAFSNNDAAFTSGVNMMGGFIGGMQYMGPAVRTAAAEQALGAQKAFRSANEEHSPSKAFFRSGNNSGLGVALGMESANDNVSSAARGMATAAQMAFSEAKIPMLPSDARSVPATIAGSPVANYISNSSSGAATTNNYNFDIDAPQHVTGASAQAASGTSAASRALDIAAMARRKVA